MNANTSCPQCGAAAIALPSATAGITEFSCSSCEHTWRTTQPTEGPSTPIKKNLWRKLFFDAYEANEPGQAELIYKRRLSFSDKIPDVDAAYKAEKTAELREGIMLGLLFVIAAVVLFFLVRVIKNAG